jgi:CO/xanthine dehydrogenase Mo-binding subunit
MDIEFLIEGGAYATLSAVVLSRGAIHAAGPYYCRNVRVSAKALRTNTPPNGAFRGFGAPQSIFALERHLDKIAEAVGLHPWELRDRNFLKPFQKTATGQIIREKINLGGLQARAMAAADVSRKLIRFERENRRGAIKRGLGIATFMHGAGFTGSGEEMLASMVRAELTPEGRLRLMSANTEIGQGANTVFSQLAAGVLGVTAACIEVAQPDTGSVPDSGPTVASRTSMVVGKLVEQCARKVNLALARAGLITARRKRTDTEFMSGARKYMDKFGPLAVEARYEHPRRHHWDDPSHKGDAYGAFAWAAYVAQVAVDTLTFEVRVEDFVALQDIGRVIHPIMAAGQIEGGVAQAIGFALYEKVIWQNGRMANNRMTDYAIPTSLDLGAVRVLFEETPYAYGPGGAKGLGELPMDGPAPAILSAVENALRLPAGTLNKIPMLPEDLLAAWEGAGR